MTILDDRQKQVVRAMFNEISKVQAADRIFTQAEPGGLYRVNAIDNPLTEIYHLLLKLEWCGVDGCDCCECGCDCCDHA